MCRSTPFWSFCFLGVNLLMSETKIGDFCEVVPELGIEIYWKFIFFITDGEIVFKNMTCDVVSGRSVGAIA